MNGLSPVGVRNASAIAGLRRLAGAGSAVAASRADAATVRCDLCGTGLPEDHRHLLHLEERRILCSCEPCRAMRSGEAAYRPTGTRVRELDGFELSDELWAKFQIPIGLAFFFLSDIAGGVVALYPSPAGATECELYLAAWQELVAANPVLDGLEPEVEALVVNRMNDPAMHAIVPIDRCYELVGMIKAGWEGISGGSAVQTAVDEFFARVRQRTVVA